MGKDIKFQVITLPNGSFEDVVERFKYLERLGFDLATTGDHFVDWTNPPSPWFEAWTLLAAVARETSNIRLATYVTQFPMRNPALLARQALTLDHISNGRLSVGLGTGLEIDPTYDMMGIPNWGAKERVARFREYVQIVNELLANEVTTFKGEYYNVDGAYMNPRPVQKPRPPTVIAALGPVMLRIAAEHADNWNSLSFAEDFESQLAETKTRIEKVDAHCEKIGRDPASLERSYLMFDPSSRAGGGAITYYQSDNLFVDMVGRITDLGVTEVGLYYPNVDSDRDAFERLATEVIPGLRNG